MTNLFVSSVSYHIYSCYNNQYIVKVAYCKLLWSHIIEFLYVLKKHLCEEKNEREISLALYVRLEYSCH